MEQSTVVDDVGLLGERDAAVADRLVQALDGGKAAVGERLVDEDPKMFGRLELRTVGWLVHEGNAVGRGQVFGISIASPSVLASVTPTQVSLEANL